MKQYLAGLTGSEARAYQRGLFMLSRPNPDPNDGTRYYNGIYAHPENGTFAIAFDPADPIPLDPAANAAEFQMDTPEEQAAWAGLIAEITAPEWEVMAQKIQTGQTLTVGDFIPASILAELISQAACEGLGFADL